MEINTIGFTDDDQGRTRWQPPTVEQLAPLFPELNILELIGRGGMGAVYKAHEKQLDRLVALKILPPEIGREEAFAQRFAREAQAMARLSHSNIVTIYSFGQRAAGELAAGGDLYFFIMEYVDGLSLRQLLGAGTVSPKEALAIVPQICDALQYAHDRGIVHRDIKPENILLNRAGQVKIADFGLAKLVGLRSDATTPSWRREPGGAPDVTQAGEKVMGTPQYMAPEQIERPREVDHRADIYSLGVVFYQMLTGELPKGKFEPPSRKVLIDVRLDEVVLRALEHEPSRRYQQVSEVRTQVETIAASRSSQRPLNPQLASSGQHQPWPSANTTRQSPPWEPPESHEAARKFDRARRAVIVSATGMIVAAGINLLLILGFLALALIRQGSISERMIGAVGDTGQHRIAAISVGQTVLFLAMLAGIAINIIIVYGAIRMMEFRNRGMAITAAILALIAAPGNIIGLPVGIWSLLILKRREVANAFATNKAIKSTVQRNKHNWKKWLKKWSFWPSVGIVLILLAWQFVLGVYRAENDAVAPEIPVGSKVFVYKLARSYKPRSIVAYRSAGRVFLGRVVDYHSPEGQRRVWIERNNQIPYAIQPADLIGLVVFNTRGPARLLVPPSTTRTTVSDS